MLPDWRFILASFWTSQLLEFLSGFISLVPQTMGISLYWFYNDMRMQSLYNMHYMCPNKNVIFLLDCRVLVLSRNLTDLKVMAGASHQQLFKLWEESIKNKGWPSRELVPSKSWPRKVEPLCFRLFNHYDHHDLDPLSLSWFHTVWIIVHDFSPFSLLMSGYALISVL